MTSTPLTVSSQDLGTEATADVARLRELNGEVAATARRLSQLRRSYQDQLDLIASKMLYPLLRVGATYEHRVRRNYRAGFYSGQEEFRTVTDTYELVAISGEVEVDRDGMEWLVARCWIQRQLRSSEAGRLDTRFAPRELTPGLPPTWSEQRIPLDSMTGVSGPVDEKSQPDNGN